MARKYISIDVEALGPCPGLYSMTQIGAVLVEDQTKQFHVHIKPLKNTIVDMGALNAIGGDLDEIKRVGIDAVQAMRAFKAWLLEVCGDAHPVFISDNNGFDWQFVNYYFHYCLVGNPFGHSSRNIQDIYKGFRGNLLATPKKYRRTPHTHNALDDAKGNAEMIETVFKLMGVKQWRSRPTN